jgi:hypothetical protein
MEIKMVERDKETVIVDRGTSDYVAPRRSSTGMVVLIVALVVILLFFLFGGMSLFGNGSGASTTNVDVKPPTTSTPSGN